MAGRAALCLHGYAVPTAVGQAYQRGKNHEPSQRALGIAWLLFGSGALFAGNGSTWTDMR
jgi:hypothetical protein